MYRVLVYLYADVSRDYHTCVSGDGKHKQGSDSVEGRVGSPRSRQDVRLEEKSGEEDDSSNRDKGRTVEDLLLWSGTLVAQYLVSPKNDSIFSTRFGVCISSKIEIIIKLRRLFR